MRTGQTIFPEGILRLLLKAAQVLLLSHSRHVGLGLQAA